MSFSPTYKPPITHLVDDETLGLRTLCGVLVGAEWQTDWASSDEQNIAAGIACSCRRCSQIAAARISGSE